MKRFACGDVVPGCTAVFHHRSEEEILTSVSLHAQHDHGMTEIPLSLVERVRSLIRDIPAAA